MSDKLATVHLPPDLHNRLMLLQACRTLEGTKVSLAATIEWLLGLEIERRRSAGTWPVRAEVPKQETPQTNKGR